MNKEKLDLLLTEIDKTVSDINALAVIFDPLFKKHLRLIEQINEMINLVRNETFISNLDSFTHIRRDVIESAESSILDETLYLEIYTLKLFELINILRCFKSYNIFNQSKLDLTIRMFKLELPQKA